MVGADDAATGLSAGACDQDNQGTSNADRFIDSNESLVKYNHSQTKVFGAQVNSFNSDGCVLGLNSHPAALNEFGLMFLGETAGATSLPVNDATHSHTADSPALTVNLVVNDATHSHTADSPGITIDLGIDAATHNHTAAATGLTAHTPLSVAAATHSHLADSPSLTVAGVTSADAGVALRGQIYTPGAVRGQIRQPGATRGQIR